MPEYRVEHLKTITDGQLNYIADLSGSIFANDRGCEVYMSGDPGLSYDYWTAYLRATILEGELWVVSVLKNGKWKIVSFACWFAPGTGLWNTEAQRALGFDDFFKKCSPELQDWMQNTRVTYGKKLFDELFTPEEQKNWWNCSCIATHPDFRRKGYATSLMDVLIQKATNSKAKQLVLAASTNHENVPALISMGLKVEGGAAIPSPRDGFYIHILVKRT